MIRRYGKTAQRWVIFRRRWFRNHPADSYNCHYCGRYLLPEQVTLDHYLPRGSHPELRFEESNIVPACYECNSRKGSMHGDKFMAIMSTKQP